MTEPTSVEPDSLRLFFALWPDEATRTALDHTGKWLHKHWDGRRMRADTLHLTLAFLGSTPVERLNTLIASADSVQTDAFELILDQAGYWQHNRIGWLGVGATPPQYLELVGALNTALQQAQFPVDPRPHVPHVTLLRKSPGGDAPPWRAVHWPVNDFVLLHSATASEEPHYEVVRRWPLRGRPDNSPGRMGT